MPWRARSTPNWLASVAPRRVLTALPRDLRRTTTAGSQRSEPGRWHREGLRHRPNLAYSTGQAGDRAGARDQLAALLPIQERALGSEHPATLASRSHLARWTSEAGDPAGARDQLAALLPIHK